MQKRNLPNQAEVAGINLYLSVSVGVDYILSTLLQSLHNDFLWNSTGHMLGKWIG